MRPRESRAKLKGGLVPGFQDLPASFCSTLGAFASSVASVYSRHGFEPFATPAVEYADVLGCFLPDEDRPNRGIFTLRGGDERRLCLRYDLTAPMARYVASRIQHLPRPFKGYQIGLVWRNEKPDPGRFREFVQADADVVYTSNLAADAQVCMLMSDALQAIGFGEHVIRVSNRKILDGILETIGLRESDPEYEAKRLSVLRAIDKFDKLGHEGVSLLLGEGRMDASGDFTRGAMLPPSSVHLIVDLLLRGSDQLDGIAAQIQSQTGRQGVCELEEVVELCRLSTKSGAASFPIRVDLSVVRGLAYYTNTVFEAILPGAPRVGAVASGGRYDSLVGRFLDREIPAVGCSLGLSRLAALFQENRADGPASSGGKLPSALVLVLDKESRRDAACLAECIRDAGIGCDIYAGTANLQGQMKYASKRGFAWVLIMGEDERHSGTVTVRHMLRHPRMETTAVREDRSTWLERGRQVQQRVPIPQVVTILRQDIQAK